MKQVYIAGIAVLALTGIYFLVSSGQEQVSRETPSQVSFTNIGIGEFQKMLNTKDFKLVNVHIPYAGDIPGTDLSVPYNRIESIGLSKDEKIVLYCRSGSMSRIAAEKLAELGYTNVFNLEGGMNAWRQAGNEIVFNS